MGNFPFAPNPALQLQAATPVAGFALQNGTPTILSWNVPNDGQLHFVLLPVNQEVVTLETGGAIGLTFTLPDGSIFTTSVFAGGSAAGFSGSTNTRFVQAGSVVTLAQTSALTAGSAKLWSQIWGY